LSIVREKLVVNFTYQLAVIIIYFLGCHQNRTQRQALMAVKNNEVSYEELLSQLNNYKLSTESNVLRHCTEIVTYIVLSIKKFSKLIKVVCMHQ